MGCWRHGRPAAHAPSRFVCLTALVAIAPLDKRREEGREKEERVEEERVHRGVKVFWGGMRNRCDGTVWHCVSACVCVCVCACHLLFRAEGVKEGCWTAKQYKVSGYTSLVLKHTFLRYLSSLSRSSAAVSTHSLACITDDRNGIVWVSPALNTSSCVADKTRRKWVINKNFLRHNLRVLSCVFTASNVLEGSHFIRGG